MVVRANMQRPAVNASEDEVDSRRSHNPVVADSSSAVGTKFTAV